jgi:hypothetical protein
MTRKKKQRKKRKGIKRKTTPMDRIGQLTTAV